MKINIVRPKDGWVLHRISESWKLPGAVCCTAPDSTADVNVWCNYALFASVGGMKKTACDVGWFTHRESGKLGVTFDEVARSVDHCIAMCEHTAAFLPSEKTSVIHTAPSELYIRRDLVLGVVGREYPRKRNHLMESIRMPGIQVRYSGGSWPASDMPEFYKYVDYIVVLSENEGGPMCVPEAMVMGKPVIAPDVGWCWDYPVIRYTDETDLVRVVRSLIPPTIQEESSQIMDVIMKATGNA